MANVIYTLGLTTSDRVVYYDGSTLINVRVRPGEKIRVDLADAEQDAAFDESKYTAAGSSPQHHTLKPSVPD